jgi:translation elongation factor EF-G
MMDQQNNSKNYSTDDFEIGDVESYGQNTDSGFSHQGLVMTALRRCLENGAKEMKAGWFQNKIDRSGNTVRTYVEDTRKSFIESVESCLDIIECDIDDIAAKEIKKLTEGLQKRYKELNDEEDKEWDSIPKNIKLRLSQEGKGNIKGYFNKDKQYYQIYLDESVKTYRLILRALSKLTARLDFYKAQSFEA